MSNGPQKREDEDEDDRRAAPPERDDGPEVGPLPGGLPGEDGRFHPEWQEPIPRSEQGGG